MVVLSVIVIGVAGQQALLKVLFFPLYPIASNKKVVIAKYYVFFFYLYILGTNIHTDSARFFITTLYPIGVGAIFPIIAALGLFYSMSFLLKTACIDPGILPRARQDELDYQLSLADESEFCLCVCSCTPLPNNQF